MWQEGGDGHQDGNLKQASSRETEERAQEPIEEAQAYGVRGAVQGLAEEGTEHHNPDDDEKKGNDLGSRGRSDEMSENYRDVVVVPTGKQNSGDQAAEREEFQDDAAHEGHDGGAGEYRDEKTVEEIHSVSDIREVGMAGNQAECFEVLLSGT